VKQSLLVLISGFSNRKWTGLKGES